MFVILVYDVNAKRDKKVLSTVRKYLNTVQNSVFDGHISTKNLKKLKDELSKRIHPGIYKFNSLMYTEKDELGVLPNSHENFL